MNLESCGCTRSNGRTPARNLSRQLLSIPVSPRLTTILPVYTPGLGKVRNQRACSQTSSDFIGKRRMTPRRLRRSEEHTSELQSRGHLVCRLLLEKKNNNK